MKIDSSVLTLVAKHWPSWPGLAIASAVISLLAVPISGVFPPQYVFPALLGPTVLLWGWMRRIRRAPKNRIGMAVALLCEDEAIERQVRADFIADLEKQIKDSGSGAHFVFMSVPEHVARRVQDAQGARWLQRRTRCMFVFFGRVRKRPIGTTERFVIDLRGLVAHRPLDKEAQSLLQKEFTDVVPNRVDFANTDGLLGFEFTAKWAHIGAKYVIGCALGLSGFFDQAHALLLEAEQLARNIPNPLPAYARIRERAPVLRANIRLRQATIAHGKWWQGAHEDSDLGDLERYLSETGALGNHHFILGFRAILAFVKDRDCTDARRLLNQTPKSARTAVWYLNQAFLYAYGGNLYRARQYYGTGAQLDIQPAAIAELEAFMEWVLESEPDRYPIYYCLGLLNRNLKGDALSALRDFESFLDNAPSNKHQRERNEVEKWVSELKASSAFSH